MEITGGELRIERIEISGGLGAYVLKVDLKLSADGEKVDSTAFPYPLPAVRLV